MDIRRRKSPSLSERQTIPKEMQRKLPKKRRRGGRCRAGRKGERKKKEEATRRIKDGWKIENPLSRKPGSN